VIFHEGCTDKGRPTLARLVTTVVATAGGAAVAAFAVAAARGIADIACAEAGLRQSSETKESIDQYP
jgi:hypothetical protein